MRPVGEHVYCARRPDPALHVSVGDRGVGRYAEAGPQQQQDAGRVEGGRRLVDEGQAAGVRLRQRLLVVDLYCCIVLYCFVLLYYSYSGPAAPGTGPCRATR